jgi:hypothetical protein
MREFEDYAYETHATPEKVQKWIEFCGWTMKNEQSGEPAGIVRDRQKLVALGPDSAAAAHAKRMQDPQFAAAFEKLSAERHEDAPPQYQWASASAPVGTAGG